MNSELYTSMLNDLFISHLRFDFQTANQWVSATLSYVPIQSIGTWDCVAPTQRNI